MKKSEQRQINRHFIFIEAPEAIVGPEIIQWGEASWWPIGCAMKFTRTTPGMLAVGATFEQRVLLPLGPRWDVEVTALVPNRHIERTFLNGMFEGKETVSTEGRLNGTRVDYLMEYRVRGIANKVLWAALFRQQHDKNIEMILSALKSHALKRCESGKN